MLTRTITAVAAIALVASLSTVAEAHPRLKQSMPASGAVLKSPPNAIRMMFSEGLEPHFTGLALTDSRGATVPTGPAAVSGPDNTELTVPLREQLKPGTYKVSWHAVSVDTHRVTGKYSFKVAR